MKTFYLQGNDSGETNVKELPLSIEVGLSLYFAMLVLFTTIYISISMQNIESLLNSHGFLLIKNNINNSS
jgi:hypothetical protein